MIPGEVLHLLEHGVPWRQQIPRGVRPLGWTRRGGRGLWTPLYPIAGGSELAVLRPTQATVPGGSGDGSEPNLDTTSLWFHGGQATSGAGGAGQFSGHSEIYEADQAGNALERLQIVYLRLLPTVLAILRLGYDNVDIFGGQGDLANMASNIRSNTDEPTGRDWGFEGVNSQTNTPDTTSLGANHSAHQVRSTIQPLSAAVIYEWAMTGVPLFSRTIGVGNQARAMSWGCWAAAVVTAITVDFTTIVRKLPV